MLSYFPLILLTYFDAEQTESLSCTFFAWNALHLLWSPFYKGGKIRRGNLIVFKFQLFRSYKAPFSLSYYFGFHYSPLTKAQKYLIFESSILTSYLNDPKNSLFTQRCGFLFTPAFS